MRSATLRGCSDHVADHPVHRLAAAASGSRRRGCVRSAPVSSAFWRHRAVVDGADVQVRAASTQLQPPGAAPRSAAFMPGCSRRCAPLGQQHQQGFLQLHRASGWARRRARAGAECPAATASGPPASELASSMAWLPTRIRRAGAAAAGRPCRSAGRACAGPGAARCRTPWPGRPAACLRPNPDVRPTARRSGRGRRARPGSGVMRSLGSRSVRSSIRRSFCRAKISVDQGRACDSAAPPRRPANSDIAAVAFGVRIAGEAGHARRARSVRRRVPARSLAGNRRASLQ